MKRTIAYIALISAGILVLSCNTKKSKSDIEVAFTQDTLEVGYTYWWPQSGPFIGNCGEELSLVFMGTITEIKDPTDDPGPLYISQKGVVELEKVFKIKDLGEQTYANQKFFTTDCFNDLGLVQGDQVLVFCYDYEGDYSIPGHQSILKINGFEDPLIKSIRTYIDEGQNPAKLKDDLGLWATHNLGRALEGIIMCREEMATKGDGAEVTH